MHRIQFLAITPLTLLATFSPTSWVMANTTPNYTPATSPDTSPMLLVQADSRIDQTEPTGRSLGQFNLTGEWVLKTQEFRLDDSGSISTCTALPNTELTMEPILTQNGNELSSDPQTLILNEGRLSGNSVYLESEVFSLNGTVSTDGNQITGTLTCGYLTQPFTMTRKSLQSSGTTPQEPIQPNTTPDYNSSELFW